MLQPPALRLIEVADFQEGLNEWNRLHPESSLLAVPSLQSQWSSTIVEKSLRELQSNGHEKKVLLLAIQRPEPGACFSQDHRTSVRTGHLYATHLFVRK